MKIKNIFTEIHLVIENIMPIFAAIQYKKEFKMKGSFLHKAAAPPLPPAGLPARSQIPTGLTRG